MTCNVPESYLRAIDKLTGKKRIYPSRSELIRLAIREWLLKELESASSFEEFQTKSSMTQDENLLESQENLNKIFQHAE
ncbi:MAG: ribbon-helix-helix domain-containing protein [Promethearchaeota archaeon]